MHATSSVVLLGLVLLAGSATAQGATSWDGNTRRVELKSDDAGAPIAVAISPGLSTVILFDADVAQDAIELESRGSFSVVDAGRMTLRLVPLVHATPGAKFRLSVRFRDGGAPSGASFLLTVHPARADNLVEVFRGVRTIESYQQEAREARAEVQRCKEENGRLVSEHGAPGGLAGLLATGGMDLNGVVGKIETKTITFDAKSAREPYRVNSYRSKKSVALEVSLQGTRADHPWTASGAALRSRSGAELKVLRIWQEAPSSSELPTKVVVEAEPPPSAAQGAYSLKLWEADGPRTVTIGNVTFP